MWLPQFYLTLIMSIIAVGATDISTYPDTLLVLSIDRRQTVEQNIYEQPSRVKRTIRLRKSSSWMEQIIRRIVEHVSEKVDRRFVKENLSRKSDGGNFQSLYRYNTHWL